MNKKVLPLYLLAMLLGMLLVACAVSGAGGDAATRSPAVSRLEYLGVQGARLYVLARGADRNAPVLLWLHGGPGGAERPLFRYFNGELERHFVVAYWDQRGAGRSFDAKAEPGRLTVRQHLADLDAVVDHLRGSLGREKIVLVGHSWGSALGLLYARDHPEKVSAFVGVSPLVSLRDAQRAEYDFVLAEASRRGDDPVLARLHEIGRPPFLRVDDQQAMETLADRYGGVFQQKPCRIWVVARAIVGGLETPYGLVRIVRGNHVSLRDMTAELLGLDLRRSVRRVDVPVFFFLGRHDRHVDATLAAAYFESLQAPVKRLVWFERSAHNVPFEEPSLFNATVTCELQSAGLLRAPAACGPGAGQRAKNGMEVE